MSITLSLTFNTLRRSEFCDFQFEHLEVEESGRISGKKFVWMGMIEHHMKGVLMLFVMQRTHASATLPNQRNRIKWMGEAMATMQHPPKVLPIITNYTNTK